MVNLNDWVEKDGFRHYLSSPFIVDDKLVACNGAVIIYRKKSDYDLYEGFSGSEDTLSRLRKLINPEVDRKMDLIAEIFLPEKVECTKCSDVCEECGGEGTVELSNDFNDYEVDCKSCDSDPEICSYCNGTNIAYPSDSATTISGAKIQHKFAELLKSFDSPVFATELDGMLHFKSGEYGGHIMCYRV